MMGREYVAVSEERGKIIHLPNVRMFNLYCGESRLTKYSNEKTEKSFRRRRLKTEN